MLPNDLSITQDAYTFAFKKVKEQGGESRYVGTATSGDWKKTVSLTFKHTTPADPDSRASSVVKISSTSKRISDGFVSETTKTHIVIDNSSGHKSAPYDFNISLLNKIVTAATIADELSAGAY